ncbi:MAG: SDR family oxidoreductase [Gammaproteobacteria bacterium]|nr:SDR family oxidoreductase [Gammaproteobacteria bacterium]
MSRLHARTAVVTGASSGIGRAIALAFAREGADLVIGYRSSRERAQSVADEIRKLGRSATAVAADLALSGSPETLLAAARSTFPRIDIWVNNAGADILTGDAARLNDAEKLDRLLAVDLRGTIHCCWAVAPVMQRQGSGTIINMSWDLAMHGFPGRNPQMFAAVKAGVLGFSKALARECAPAVRVNVLAPGWIKTAFAEAMMESAFHDARVGEIPLGRFGEAADVANAAVYLASDESRYITGQVLNVNGGVV